MHYPRPESLILTPLNESIVLGKIAATHLALSLDLLTVSPIHHPLYWDQVIGAVSLDDSLLFTLAEDERVRQAVFDIRRHLIERTMLFKKERIFQVLKNRTIIVVAEGCRTGLKLVPSLQLLAKERPKKIVFAAPIIGPDAYRRLNGLVDDIHSLFNPMPYDSTRSFYNNFRLYDDQELARIFRS